MGRASAQAATTGSLPRVDGAVVDVAHLGATGEPDARQLLAALRSLTDYGERPDDPAVEAIAAMVADVVLESAQEGRDPHWFPTPEATLERYFGVRVLTNEVLAYLDALGVHDAAVAPRDLGALAADVYASAGTLARCRVQGILRLLARYRFAIAVERDWGADLMSQAEPVGRMVARVRAAAARALATAPVEWQRAAAISEEATAMFLEWIELLTLRYREELAVALMARSAG
jgi:hypothetical protein